MTLPSLAGIPARLWTGEDTRIGAEFARALLLADLAEPDDWLKCNGDPVFLAFHTLSRWIGEARAETIDRHFQLNAAFVSGLRSPSWLGDLERVQGEEDGVVYLIVESMSCIVHHWGGVLERLEYSDKRLPSAWYHRFVDHLRGPLEVFDHRDAQAFHESRVWGMPRRHRPPAPCNCVPKCLRRHWLADRTVERMVGKIDDVWARMLLESTLEMCARAKPLFEEPLDEFPWERAGADFALPMLALGVAFEGYDDVEAVIQTVARDRWEGEGHIMLGGGPPAPKVCLRIDYRDLESVRRAYRVFDRCLELMAAASNILDLADEWAAEDGLPLRVTLGGGVRQNLMVPITD